jgi:transcriptional regulator with XRE-family HTH domain
MGKAKLTNKGLATIIAKMNELDFSEEQLALESRLNRGTVSKVLCGQKSVNLRTVHKLFIGLELELSNADYTLIPSVSVHSTKDLEMGEREDVGKVARDLRKQAEKIEKTQPEEAETIKNAANKLEKIANPPQET